MTVPDDDHEHLAGGVPLRPSPSRCWPRWEPPSSPSSSASALLDGSVHLGIALAVLVLAPEVYLPLRRAGAEFHASAEGQAAADRILGILDEGELAGLRDRSPPDTTTARLPDVGPSPSSWSGCGALPGRGVTRPRRRGPHRPSRVSTWPSPGSPGSGSRRCWPSCWGSSSRGRGVGSQWAAWISASVPCAAGVNRSPGCPNVRTSSGGRSPTTCLLRNPDADGRAPRRPSSGPDWTSWSPRCPEGWTRRSARGGITLSAGERQRVAIGRAVAARRAPGAPGRTNGPPRHRAGGRTVLSSAPDGSRPGPSWWPPTGGRSAGSTAP